MEELYRPPRRPWMPAYTQWDHFLEVPRCKTVKQVNTTTFIFPCAKLEFMHILLFKCAIQLKVEVTSLWLFFSSNYSSPSSPISNWLLWLLPAWFMTWTIPVLPTNTLSIPVSFEPFFLMVFTHVEVAHHSRDMNCSYWPPSSSGGAPTIIGGGVLWPWRANVFLVRKTLEIRRFNVDNFNSSPGWRDWNRDHLEICPSGFLNC